MRRDVGELGTSAPRREIRYLDGLRGVCALYVVLYHAYIYSGATGEAQRDLPVVGYLLNYGFLGVPIFIVLSGYVLMLPCIDADYRLPRGAWTFVRRRARRILPPYYAALALSLVLILAFPVMAQPSGTQWDSKVPVTSTDVIVHTLLMHDFSPNWISKINGPLWSVAIEWQIYFVFFLALLPLWRRLNARLLVAALLLLSVGLGIAGLGSSTHPWFVGLFAVGMLAADNAAHAPSTGLIRWALAGAGVITVVLLVATYGVRDDVAWASEIAVGICAAMALVLAARRSESARQGWIVRTLSARWLVFAGLISYSVYLFHGPILALGNLLLLPIGMPIDLHFAIMLLVVTPVTLVVCFAAFWAVERNFLNTRQHRLVVAQGGDPAAKTRPSPGK